MPHPVHMFYGNLALLGKKSNSVIRSRSVTVKNWCTVLSMEGVTVCGHHQECRVKCGRGGPHIQFILVCLLFKTPMHCRTRAIRRK